MGKRKKSKDEPVALKQRGRPRGARSKRINNKVEVLLTALRGSIAAGEWDRYWTILDITQIVYHGDNFITLEKKQKAGYALGIVKRILKQEDGIAFYSVPTKGYRLWPDFTELPESMKEQTVADALGVFRKWLDYAKTLIGTNGPLIAMKERGQLRLGDDDRKLIETTATELKSLVKG